MGEFDKNQNPDKSAFDQFGDKPQQSEEEADEIRRQKLEQAGQQDGKNFGEKGQQMAGQQGQQQGGQQQQDIHKGQQQGGQQQGWDKPQGQQE